MHWSRSRSRLDPGICREGFRDRKTQKRQLYDSKGLPVSHSADLSIRVRSNCAGTMQTQRAANAHCNYTSQVHHGRPFGTAPPRATGCRGRATRQHVVHVQTADQLLSVDRRDMLLKLSSATAAAFLSGLSSPNVSPAAAAAQPQVPEVGTYLPPAGIDDLVLFQPDARKTPALRAGTVDPSSPYKFAMPPSFRCGLTRAFAVLLVL